MDRKTLKAIGLTAIVGSTVPAYDALTNHTKVQANRPAEEQTIKSKDPMSRKPPGINNAQSQQLLSNQQIIKEYVNYKGYKELKSDAINLVKSGKIKHISNEPNKIINQIESNLLHPNTLKLMSKLANQFDSIKIWEPYREGKEAHNHGKGMSLDFKSVTADGKEYLVDDFSKGKHGAIVMKILNSTFESKTTRQILMAGPFVENLRNQVNGNFNANAGEGSVSKIRIGTTYDAIGSSEVETKTLQHFDHFHFDVSPNL